jgi:hypothetical protein
MYRVLLRAKTDKGTKDWQATAKDDAVEILFGASGTSLQPARVGLNKCLDGDPRKELKKRMGEKRKEGYWVVETQSEPDAIVRKIGQLYANQINHIDTHSAQRFCTAIRESGAAGDIEIKLDAGGLTIAQDQRNRHVIPVGADAPATRLSIVAGPDQSLFAVLLALAHLVPTSEVAVEENGRADRIPSLAVYAKTQKSMFSSAEIALFEEVGLLPKPVRIGRVPGATVRSVFGRN